MRRRGKPLACLLVAASLASPAAAFGQSAGDEQYEDPFAPTEEEQQEPEPAPTPAPEAPAPSEPAAEPAQAPAPAPAAAEQEPQLPYTGAEAGLIALAGGTLVISGLALRRRTNPRADRA